MREIRVDPLEYRETTAGVEVRRIAILAYGRSVTARGHLRRFTEGMAWGALKLSGLVAGFCD